MNRNRREREAGQTVLVAALAMIPLLIMVGLVVDGGFAYATNAGIRTRLTRPPMQGPFS